MAKSKGNRIGLWIIVGLLFVGLIGFGSAGLQSGIRTIGSVGSKDIRAQSYYDGVSQQLRAIEQQFGVRLTFAQAQSEGVPDAVLGQLVNNRVLDNEATNLGLSAGDAFVLEQVLANPAFRGISGEFDREQYSFALENQGLTEQQYEDTLREGAARSLLQAAVVTGIPDPEVYVDARAAYLGEQRSITWAALDASALGDDLPEPTEEEVRAHYDANPDLYTSPEVRQISYAWITPDMLQDEIEIDEAMLQELYDERIDIYVLPERRLTERLNFSDEDAANAALAQIEAGETTFDTLVIERGLDLSDVDLGDVGRDDLGDAADAVFAADAGDVVGPIQTDLGPALFRMNAVLSAQETTFDEVRDDLRAEIATSRAARLISNMRNDVTDLVAGGAAIEDLVDRTDLQQGQIDWSTDVTEGIAAYDSFRVAATSATEGAFPEVVELSDGGMFVLRLDGVIEPAVIPFEDVIDQATQDRRAAALQEAVVAQTEALISTLATTGDFEAAELTPQTHENLTRNEFVAGTPEGFTSLVFAMAEGDVSTMETETGTLIVRLDTIAPADFESEAMLAVRDDLSQRTGIAVAQDIYAVFTSELRDRTDVSIDDNAVAQINAQFR